MTVSRPQSGPTVPATRRHFLTTSAALAGTALAGGLLASSHVHAAGGETLRVGLVGSGGRGRGAAEDALRADANVKLVAIGDTFADQVSTGLSQLSKFGDKMAVDRDHCFVGFDAYKKVIDCCDVVLLCTPPHFRPAQLRYAIEQGKHVFAEKPVCVDGPGYRSVLETVKLADQKRLSIVSGLCWRYDNGVNETMKRVLDGAIGEIVTMQENYLAAGLWHKGRKPQWSEMEYQIRNWLYFTWLSGDHNVEQHVHSLDKAGWAMKEEPPVRATGLGGRQVRTDAKYGHIFDHHAVCYEYANGVRMFAFTRQQDGAAGDTDDYFFGTEGRCQVLKNTVYNRKGDVTWRYRATGPKVGMYQQEHNELFGSVRSGKPINNGLYMAKSSMLAILGRMATYTGQTITWDQAINSKEDLAPAKYEWGPIATPRVALPGITEFA